MTRMGQYSGMSPEEHTGLPYLDVRVRMRSGGSRCCESPRPGGKQPPSAQGDYLLKQQQGYEKE